MTDRTIGHLAAPKWHPPLFCKRLRHALGIQLLLDTYIWRSRRFSSSRSFSSFSSFSFDIIDGYGFRPLKTSPQFAGNRFDYTRICLARNPREWMLLEFFKTGYRLMSHELAIEVCIRACLALYTVLVDSREPADPQRSLRCQIGFKP